MDFFHWVLVDLPADAAPIERGEFSDGVTARGKPGPQAPRGARQGINDYTGWFAGDKDMAGNYFGYDGPCPPWNDELPHRYVFTLMALDVARLGVAGVFTGPDVRNAVAGHVLAKASVTGRYTLNPAVAALASHESAASLRCPALPAEGLAPRRRIERPTCPLGGGCSIH